MDCGGICEDGKVLRPKQVELREKRKKLLEEHKREDAERKLRKDWWAQKFKQLHLKIDEIVELEEDLLAVQLSRIEIRRRTALLMKQKEGADVDQENRGIIPLNSKPMRSILKSIENSPKWHKFPSTSTSTVTFESKSKTFGELAQTQTQQATGAGTGTGEQVAYRP